MKLLAGLTTAAIMLSASAIGAVGADMPESWTLEPTTVSCFGQGCCDLLKTLPLAQRSAFRAAHAYCTRSPKRDARDPVPTIN